MVAHSLTPNTELDIKNALVSCECLKQNLHQPDLAILDATFFLPRQQRNALREFKNRHIPGAQFFDIDAISDPISSLPHTLPSAEQFAHQVSQLGIANETWVIVYDDNHFFASARVWWMFRAFGHERLKVLNGGLKRWQSLQYPLNADEMKPTLKSFNAVFHPEVAVDLEQMRLIQQSRSKQILDARSTDSFNGQRPLSDTRLQPGHIPGSINIPYRSLFDEKDDTLLPVAQLRQVFSDTAVDFSKPIVTTCGTGVSATLLLLALYQIGIDDAAMYDGSWAEWGRQPDLPKQINP